MLLASPCDGIRCSPSLLGEPLIARAARGSPSARVALAAVLALFLAALVPPVAADVETSFNRMASYTIDQVPCVKLMTAAADGDIGCSSSEGGNTGALFRVLAPADVGSLDLLPSEPKRVLVLELALVTGVLLDAVKANTRNVAGMIITNINKPAAFSPASRTPGGSTTVWNPVGLDLLAQKYPFPIVMVADVTQAREINSKASQNTARGHNEYPMHAASLFFYFGPSGLTSTTCLRDSSCQPVGGQSVWASFGDLRTGAVKPVVLATAAMDADSLFHDVSPGAETTVSGLVALLAAANALSQFKASLASLPSRVAFGVFQAEAYGRVGSRRFAQEVKNFTCATTVSAANSPTGFQYCRNPLRVDLSFTNISSFAHIVAVDQVGILQGNKGYVTGPASLAQSVVLASATGVAGLPAMTASGIADSPVTPLTSFLENFPGTSSAIISDYRSSYNTRYYQSSMDDFSTITAGSVTAFSTVLARSLYALATGIADPTAALAAVPAGLQANATLVSDMLQCFAGNATCTIFSAFLGGQYSVSTPLPMYASVYNAPYPSGDYGFGVGEKHIETFVLRYLAHCTLTSQGITGENTTCTSSAACRLLDPRLLCIKGVCGVRTAFTHDALSPALTRDTAAKGGFTIDSSKLDATDPLWTEPYWSSSIGATGITLGNPVVAKAVFAAGVLAIFASAGSVYWLRRFASNRFKVE